jgi:hypothetical protein
MSYDLIQTIAREHLERPDELEIEKRAGVDHLATGQHHARIVAGEEDDIESYVEVSFAPIDGHRLVVIHLRVSTLSLPEDPEGHWAIIITEHGLGAERLPADFKPTELMLEAARAAIDREQSSS